MPLTVRRRAKPPSPSPSITRRRTPAAFAAGVPLLGGQLPGLRRWVCAGRTLRWDTQVGRSGARLRPAPCSSAPDHQIVAMNHLGPAGKAEDRADFAGRTAPDLVRIFGVV